MQSKSSASAREFRKATKADLPAILAIYARARRLMAANGNPTQWGKTFPRESVIRDDIKCGRCTLLVDHLGGTGADVATEPGRRPLKVSTPKDPNGYRNAVNAGVAAGAGDGGGSGAAAADSASGSERILAVFALCPGEDPTYKTIDGAWLDDDQYVTLHRVASAGLVKGAAHIIFRWVLSRYSNVRVDTHPNNKAMQHVLAVNGFTRCGTIQLIDRPTDTLRIAFQRHDRRAA
ncbi:N-acetyltransferase [Bifidobacterium avesanii]|uniref:N-acetyltransferase n=1 Tax=Bifidobacterium avesanii TaxID=1798157 RepID=UPI00137EDC78|nr:N-acetyltransferase [Bifidobacterium avesanii]KAB8287142.1 histone acetyltransferase [Bifidobacterium avesanii]